MNIGAGLGYSSLRGAKVDKEQVKATIKAQQYQQIDNSICFAAVRPFSKNTYRKINRVVTELLWIQLIWLVDWWAGLKVRVYADAETFDSLGKEHALVISNHRSDIDWLVGWVLAQRSGCLGSALAVMKKSLTKLPVIGWSMWFSEYLFIERSWARDENTLKFGMQNLKDYPKPFWLALFVEGTRYTPAKLLAAQEYAASQGLPIPQNTLIPRTKGFVSAVNNMRSFVPAIYDCTVVIPRDSPSPTMLQILKGQSSVIHVLIKRQSMSGLPQANDGVAQWCKDAFVEKDALIEKHLVEDTFGEELFKPINRPIKSLLVVGAWACLLSYAAVRFFKWSSLSSTWKGIGVSLLILVLVMIVMHVIILQSQSERSASSIKAAQATTHKEHLVSLLQSDHP